jgi:predicted transcriptional regulator of viral defense system
MRFIQFKDALKNFTVFSLNDIKLIDPHFHRRRLIEWQEKGYIKKVARGRYIFSDLPIDENVLFEIANRLYSPSYVSLESALSYYQIIPEAVYGITSVSTRRTYSYSTRLAKFQYQTIKPSIFLGYQIVTFNSKAFKIADMEKAVLDFFYLHPNLKSESDIISLRFNAEAFRQMFNRKKLQNYLRKFAKNALSERISIFLELMANNGQDKSYAGH